MFIKRLIIGILTILAVLQVSFSLLGSWNEPQIQSRLELYQTNLLLHAREFSDGGVSQALIGQNPLAAAQKQYADVRENAQKTLEKLQQSPAEPRKTSRLNRHPDLHRLIDELDLRLGILQSVGGEAAAAKETWQAIADRPNASDPLRQTAQALIGLWSESPQVQPDTQELLQSNLDSWFRYQALAKLYQAQQQPEERRSLQAQEQAIAEQAVWKLAIVGGIPALGLFIGTGLLIFLLLQWLLARWGQPIDPVLGRNAGVAWETPWTWEEILQVIAGGFFFIFFLAGAIVMPLLVESLGLEPASFSIRCKAAYALCSYLLVAAGGLSVLFLSARPFFPLPADWFRFKLLDNWFVWGLGGYLTALPLVILVSLLNQHLWQGQGGSNPILPIALENRDGVAMGIFFFTASVAAPVFEEIMFRGFLLPSLTRYMPVWGAIAASSLLFAAAHLNISEVLPLATLGAVLAFVYTRSRNLLAPIFLHSLWNSGTLLSLFILGSGSS